MDQELNVQDQRARRESRHALAGAESEANEGPRDNTWLSPSQAFSVLHRRLDSSAVKTQISSEITATQWVALPLGEVGLLLPVTWPKELVDAVPLCDVPFAPAWLRGFVNLRSQPVPVVDLVRYFGLGNSNALTETNLDFGARSQNPEVQKKTDWIRSGRRQSYLLRVGEGRKAFALEVDCFPQKLLLKEETRVSRAISLPTQLQRCAGDLFYHERLWVEWDLKRFCQSLSENL